MSIDPQFKPLEGVDSANILHISLSADRKRLAFCAQKLTQPDNAQVWQIEGPKKLTAFVNPDGTRAWIALTPSGEKVLCCYGAVIVCSVDDGKEERTVEVGGGVEMKVAYAAGRVAFTTSKGLEVWDVAPTKNLFSQPHDKGYPALSGFFDGGNKIATAEKGIVTFWDVPAKKAAGTMDTKNAQATASGFFNNRLTVSPQGKHLAGFPILDEFRVWEFATGRLVFEAKAATLPRFGGTNPAFLPDERTLVLPQRGGPILLIDLTTGRPTATLTGHGKEVRCLTVATDGKTLALADEDGLVKVWDPP